MKRLFLLPAFLIPMDLSEWSKTKFPFKGLPDFSRTERSWTVTTDDDVGGYAYLLDVSKRNLTEKTQLNWSWQVLKKPPGSPVPPFKKDDDDYAVRIGALIDTKESMIPLPSALKSRLKKQGASISRFIFYVPAAGIVKKRCAPSPHSKRGLTCQIPASEVMSAVTVAPLKDLAEWLGEAWLVNKRARLIGLWAFADSDDTDSKTEARVSNLRIVAE